MPIVEARSLVKEEGDVPILTGFDLDIAEGEIFAVVGPPAAGKSTLIDLLSTATPPTRGSLLIGGLDARSRRAEIRKLVGVARQSIALHPELSGAENLHLFGGVYGLNRSRLRSRVDGLLAELDLDPRSREPVRTLDGDRRRRIHFAAALVHAPRLVLLDEPTDGCGPEATERMSMIMAKLPESGSTVVIATRRVGLAERLCPRIAVLAEGRLCGVGTPRELGARLAHRAVLRLRTRDSLRAQAIDGLMGGRGYALEPHLLELRADDADEAAALLAQTAERLHRAHLHLAAAEIREPDLRTIVFELTGHRLDS